MPPKNRGPRVTSEQMECILEFLGYNKIVMLGGKTHSLNIDELPKLWNELATKLNTFKNGPVKTAEDWKRFFIELKSKTKKKARDVAVNIRCTGGGGNPKKLSDIEERLMSLIGWVTITGNSELPDEMDPSALDITTSQLGHEQHSTEVETTKEIIIEDLSENVILEVTELDDENTVIGSEEITIVEDEIQKGPVEVDSNISEATYTAKRERQKLKKITSTNILHQSANIFAESSRDLSTSLKYFAESITTFAESVKALAESIRYYAEVEKEKMDTNLNL